MKKKLQISTDAEIKEYNQEKAANMKKGKHSLDPEFENREDKKEQNQDEDDKDQLKHISYYRLYRYASRTDNILILIGILCSVAAGIGTPLIMIFFGDITGGIVTYAIQLYDPSVVDTTEIENALMEVVMRFVYNCLIVGGSVFVLSYISIALFNFSCTNQVVKIRSLYMKAVLNQDIGWYDVNQTGDFSSRITGDMLKVEEGIGDKVATFCFFMSTSFAGIIIALVYGWELALICLVSLPASALTLGFIAWITTKFSLKEMESYASAGAIAEEVLGAIKTVMAFGGQQKEIDRYKVHLETVCHNNTKRSLLTGISNGIMWFIIFASYALSFYYGIGLILKERDLPPEEQTYNEGTMITVFFCVLIASFTITQCMPYLQIFAAAQGAAAKIFSVIDSQPEINLSKGKGLKWDRCEGHIVFSDVEFQYPARKDVQILKGINLEILPGQTVAFVGSSGCGKSTCIQLLQRFYDPTKGNITMDGEDIRNFDLDWYRSRIGVVGQEPVLFATSIGENIKFGNKSATDEDIVKAATKSNAHSFISTLPERYRTLVGDRGSQLSGGQKQRIAIARALVREPTILLLDEATSALDVQSEVLVQQAISSISKECTTIIVAHRLSTIRNADKIVVFSDGGIVETGTHDQLMRLKGTYYNLVITQISDNKLEQSDSTSNIDSHVEEEPIDFQKDKDGKDSSQRNVKNWSAILSVLALNKPEWWQIVIGAISSVISGAAMPVYAIVFGDVMGVFMFEDPNDVRAEGNKYSLYFLIIGIVSGIAMFFQWYMIGLAGEKLTKRVRALMFETILRQEPGWFDREENSVGAVSTKLSSDAANIQGASGHPVIVALNSLSTLIIAISISIYFEWRLALVSMSIMPLIFLGTFFETKYMQSDSGGDKNSLENSAKIAIDGIGNIRTVASLGCEETFYTLYTTELMPYYKKAKRSAYIRAGILAMSRTLMNFAYIIAFWYGGVLIVQEKMNYTVVFKVSEALISAAWSVGNVMAFSPNFQKAIIAANKMFDLMKREPKIKDDENSTHTGWAKGDIRYDQIEFSYPTRPNVTVLNSLNLAVAHGKTVALVGPSGCGKSTVVQLLQRFYDPNSGRVTIDDINLKNIKIAALRSNLGIVSQEPNLFDRTIEENIAYGDNQRLVTDAEIIEAAKNANIHGFISSLPLGYGTRLGQKGAQLSGGQKQRVAIARALVRNPKILLLDEATSALDMESEKIVQEALVKAQIGRTCITIAHRLTTIQDADVICVFNNGQIVEHGTHANLLSLKGLYYKLYSLQKNQK